MPTWNANQYLRFFDQRTQPCRDLAQRVLLESPRRVIDLGCGPGNSTAVLARRWPKARITGLDSSAEMLAAARESVPDVDWVEEDISNWRPAEKFHLVFSNAALQWVSNHAELFPRLMANVAPGGALAVQMPANYHDAPAHRLMREIAGSSRWKNLLPRVRTWHVQELPFYFDALSPLASRLELWSTQYIHILAGPQEIVEWYRGTGLRPYLDALTAPADRESFLAQYQAAVAAAYPPQRDGKVLFPFSRIFLIAWA